MAWYHRWLNIFRSARISREIEQEIEFHIDSRAAELRAAGLPESAAREMARRQFGNPTALRERTREADIADWTQSVAGDLRYGARALRRSPAFATVAILSLGLGIGANTTIFTLLDAVVLRPLPVDRPERLVQITYARGDASGAYFTNPLWEQIRDRQDVFRAAAAFGETSFDLADGGEARRAEGAYVSGDYFATFAVSPAVGRLIARDDDHRGCAGIAVLSHRFWQREYGGARDVVGRRISLTGHPFDIVGVAGESFRGADAGSEADVYVPICSEAVLRGDASRLDQRSSWYLRIMARLRDDVELPQAAARMATLAPTVYAETVPSHWRADVQREYRTRPLYVVPAPRGLSAMRTRYAGALYALMCGVALVLLIACANVANLLLSRAEARQREFAIRLAIGAARARLVRQLLTESGMLAVAGAITGLVIAHLGTRAMIALFAPRENAGAVSLDLALNGRLIAFTVAVTAATVLVFGLAPAWRATRISAQASMKGKTRGVVDGQSRWSVGKTLVAAQVALSLMLVVSAGLLVGTFRALSRVDPGFDAHGLLLVDVDLRRTDIPPPPRRETYESILDRARAETGVVSASYADITPLSGSSWNEQLEVEGAASGTEPVTWFNEVGDSYFATLGTRLLEGRDFGREDVPGSAPVAIVNDAWARKFFGDASPLGKRFRTVGGPTPGSWTAIVGVVENAKYRTLREVTEPIAYLPRSQNSASGPLVSLHLRSAGDARTLIPTVTRLMREIHPGIVLEFQTLEGQLAGSLRRERMLAVLSGLFGALALGLAMLGLYGVMTYAVERRRGELGVRIALGAIRGRVVRMVIGESALVVSLGIAIGVFGALASARLVATFLYGVRPTDPAVYVISAVLLGSAALLAAMIPAWRASRVDPIEALREQ
jgi:predicted permease